MRKRALYTLWWERKRNESGDIEEWNHRTGMNASEVAYILETMIIPKKLKFSLGYRMNGEDMTPFMRGGDVTIVINRDFLISPTILKALN